VAAAAKSVLGTALLVTHEALTLSTDLLQLAPVPGLAEAARTLLNIWDALESVDVSYSSLIWLKPTNPYMA
jgi:abelson tyrosine-protein kinase 1